MTRAQLLTTYTFGVVLVILFTVCNQLVNVDAGLPGSRPLYLVKGDPIQDVPAAVAQLRRFLTVRRDKLDRCQRFGVLLQYLRRVKMDQFKIADLALMGQNQLRGEFNKIDVNQLRDLYIEAVKGSLDEDRFDAGILELVECLRDRYRSVDPRAAAFLNSARIKTVVAQYNMVASQPMSLIIDPSNHQMPADVSYESLDASIKHYLLRLFFFDERKVEELFKRAENQAGPKKSRKTVVETIEVSKENPAPIPSGNIPPAEPLEPIDDVAEFGLDEEDHNYSMLLFDSLTRVYNSLSPDVKIGDRCQAYSFVIAASEVDLREEAFFTSLIESLEAHIKEAGSTEIFQMADEKKREDFILVAELAAKLMLDNHPVYYELDECVKQLAGTSTKVA